MKQVNSDYYFQRRYGSFERFISYFKQIDLILNNGAQKILFIGMGDGLIVNYLKRSNKNLEITTYDIDSDLCPDVVGDIRNFSFEKNNFDLVVAFQVLEHIPFEYFEGVLEKISRITKSLIISLPYRRTGFEFVFKFPFIRSLLKRNWIDIKLPINLRFPGFKESGQHYWEIDRKNFCIKKIKDAINKNFKILKIDSMPLDFYRCYFLLEKKPIQK